MNAAMMWAAGGLALMVAEVLLPGIYLVWIGLSALIAGGLTWVLVLGGTAQVVSFVVVLSAIMAVIWKTGFHRRRMDRLNAPDNGTVGRTVLAQQFANGRGRVRLGDSDWQARLAEAGADPEPGTPLTVVGVDGITLVVR
ncbi:NfeD family protein [Rhodovarius crocodyli]|uniref:NfeD family protein n=2 Tax=Rhodovarius crocodyli TaxID=1979269 RepID=A0A437MNK3_9PROT|nr:NfeD family protein [Rhodovarius crocodyli]